MTRKYKSLFLILFSLFLVACSQQSDSPKQVKKEYYLTLIVKEDTDTIS